VTLCGNVRGSQPNPRPLRTGLSCRGLSCTNLVVGYPIASLKARKLERLR